MKHCLIIGGGSKFGSAISHALLKHDYHVHSVTSHDKDWEHCQGVTVYPIDWSKLSLQDLAPLVAGLPVLDVIIFNHNASSLSHDKFKKGKFQNLRHWQQSYFAACQWPFYLIHAMSKRIHPNTKIAWMLSSLTYDSDQSQVGFADYIGNKVTNAAIMKSFAVNFPAVFLGFTPELELAINSSQRANTMVEILQQLDSNSINGQIFKI